MSQTGLISSPLIVLLYNTALFVHRNGKKPHQVYPEESPRQTVQCKIFYNPVQVLTSFFFDLRLVPLGYLIRFLNEISALMKSILDRILYQLCYKRKSHNLQADLMSTSHLVHQNNTALFVEGNAKIFTKYLQKNQQGQTVESQVFYNPVQVFNRDLSVLAIQTYIDRLKQEKSVNFQGATIVDALSASGLRTIRYLKEISGVKKIIANDILPAAQKLMKDNFELNDLNPSQFQLSLQDANVLLREGGKQFDVIDLDPYGSVVPFLDAAVSAVRDGGLLCITCTDTRVLCGPDLAKCFYYYGSVRSRVHDFNENALRILLFTVSAAAGRNCRYIEPLLSLQTDFYVRVFVRIRDGKKECGLSSTKIGNILNCEFCGYYESQPFFRLKEGHPAIQKTIGSNTHCPVCLNPLQLDGPLWLDKINDHSFSEESMKLLNDQNSKLPLATKKKINGVLHGILSEGDMSMKPLSFNLDLACKTIHSTGISKQALLSAVKSLGAQHQLIPSYLTPGHYKTNLPMTAVYDILKAWKLKELGEDKYLGNVKQQHALNILKAPLQFKPDFDFKYDDKSQKVPRFISLGKGLGPKGKAGKRVLEEGEQKEPEKLLEKEGQSHK